VLLVLFPPLHLVLALLLRSDRARLVVASHHQAWILQRQVRGRPAPANGEHLELVLSGLLAAGRRLADALM
jgi:hypothetical protein